MDGVDRSAGLDGVAAPVTVNAIPVIPDSAPPADAPPNFSANLLIVLQQKLPVSASAVAKVHASAPAKSNSPVASATLEEVLAAVANALAAAMNAAPLANPACNASTVPAADSSSAALPATSSSAAPNPQATAVASPDHVLPSGRKASTEPSQATESISPSDAFVLVDPPVVALHLLQAVVECLAAATSVSTPKQNVVDITSAKAISAAAVPPPAGLIATLSQAAVATLTASAENTAPPPTAASSVQPPNTAVAAMLFETATLIAPPPPQAIAPKTPIPQHSLGTKTDVPKPPIPVAADPLAGANRAERAFLEPSVPVSDNKTPDSVTPAGSAGPPAMPLATPATTHRNDFTTVATHDPQRLIERIAEAMSNVRETGRGISMQLSPPDLGPVRIEVHAEAGVITARVETQTDAAQQVLTEHLSQLHEALAQRGAAIDRVDIVRSDPRDFHSGTSADPNWSAAGQQAQQDARESPRRRPATSARSKQEASITAPPLRPELGLQELNVRI